MAWFLFSRALVFAPDCTFWCFVYCQASCCYRLTILGWFATCDARAPESEGVGAYAGRACGGRSTIFCYFFRTGRLLIAWPSSLPLREGSGGREQLSHVDLEPLAKPRDDGACEVRAPALDGLEHVDGHIAVFCGFSLRPSSRLTEPPRVGRESSEQVPVRRTRVQGGVAELLGAHDRGDRKRTRPLQKTRVLR